MKRYSLYIIVLAIIVILTLISLATIYFFVSQHKKDLINAMVEEKIRLAETVNDIFFSPQYSYEMMKAPALEKVLIVDMAKFKDVKYIRIVAADGSIYRSSLDDDWDKTINDSDINKALSSKKSIVRDETFNSEQIKTVIFPGDSGKTIWIGFSTVSVQQIVNVILTRDVSIILGGLLLTTLMIFILLRWGVIAPLQQVIFACQEVQKGNLNQKINIKSKTEIKELADTFNSMIDNIRKSHDEMAGARAGLEVKVNERTKEKRELTESLY